MKSFIPIETDAALRRRPLTRLAERIVRYGLQTPAVFFLEMTKPLSLFGSQALYFFGPVVTAFMRSDAAYNQIAELLEDRENVEFLVQEIERINDEKQKEQASPTQRSGYDSS